MRKFLFLTLFIFFNSYAQDLASIHAESGVTAPRFFDKSNFRRSEYETYGITEFGIQKLLALVVVRHSF